MSPLKQGVLVPTEREKGDVVTGIREAYFMDHPTLAGHYVLGTGAKNSEATAYLKESATPGVYVLDDDPANEDRKLYAVGTEVF